MGKELLVDAQKSGLSQLPVGTVFPETLVPFSNLALGDLGSSCVHLFTPQARDYFVWFHIEMELSVELDCAVVVVLRH